MDPTWPLWHIRQAISELRGVSGIESERFGLEQALLALECRLEVLGHACID